jgi:DNA-binding YbaB/EbfC family protein
LEIEDMNIMEMMKQAAQLKSKMEEMQASLEAIEVEGLAGGGLVKVTLNGKTEMKGVSVDASLLKPEEKEIVEDLIVAAHADARRKAEGMMAEKMKEVTGGLPLPPGFKL